MPKSSTHKAKVVALVSCLKRPVVSGIGWYPLFFNHCTNNLYARMAACFKPYTPLFI